MRVLLDTHSLLWFVLNDARLSETARKTIADAENDVLVRPASYWEIAIKISVGKYSIGQPFQQFFENHIAHNNFLSFTSSRNMSRP